MGRKGCSNVCSGNGICNEQENICECDDGYFL